MGGTEKMLWATSLFFAAAFLLILLVQQFDQRLIDGVLVWAKPAKFAISTAVHYATLALVIRFLSVDWQQSNPLFWFIAFSIFWAVAEVGYISIQGARAMPSHFNVSTPFYSAMYSMMAFGAVMIILSAGVFGFIAAIDGQSAMSPPLRMAVAIGLVGGTILTLITAFRLGGNMGPFVGTELAGALRMPITGWSLTIGDLRPAHFLSTHMIQVVPFFGLVAARILPSPWGFAAVIGFALAWTILTLRAFTIALDGRPVQQLLAIN